MAHLSGFRRATLVIALSVAALSLVAVTPADGDVQAIHSMTEAELARSLSVTTTFLAPAGAVDSTADFTFTPPDAPACQKLGAAVRSAGEHATVDGARWTANQGRDEVNETIWVFDDPKRADAFRRQIRQASIDECSKGSAEQANASNGFTPQFGTFGTLPKTVFPSRASGVSAFADTAVQIGATDGTATATSDFLTIWLQHDDTVARLATRLASADAVDAAGTVQPDWVSSFDTLVDGTAKGLVRIELLRFANDGAVALVQDLTGSTLVPVPGYELPPPDPDPSPTCEEYAGASKAAANFRAAAQLQGQGARITLVDNGFRTTGAAAQYLEALRASGIAKCLDETLSSSPNPTTTVTAHTVEVTCPKMKKCTQAKVGRDSTKQNLWYSSDVSITSGASESEGLVAYGVKLDGRRVAEVTVQAQLPAASGSSSGENFGSSSEGPFDFLGLLLRWFSLGGLKPVTPDEPPTVPSQQPTSK